METTIKEVKELLKQGYSLLPQMEEWKPIKNYEGLYEISQYARIKSLIRTRCSGRGRYAPIKERMLKTALDSTGYLMTAISKSGKSKSMSIHRTVWDYFGDSPRNAHTLQVDHVYNDRLNCTIWNLQLLTGRANICKEVELKKRDALPLGVYKRKNRFAAQITLNRKVRYLGAFRSPELASQLYRFVRKQIEITDIEDSPLITSIEL